MGCGSINLAQVLAQLGRNVVELELGVDFFFGLSCDGFLGIEFGQAVLAQGVTHLQGALAQGHVVGFRSGEVLHGGAEGFGRQKAHVHLHAAAQTKADFVFAAGDDFHQAGKLDDVLDQLLAGGVIAAGLAGDQDVEVTNGVASAAQRAGGRYFFHTGIVAKMLDDLFGLAVRQHRAGNGRRCGDSLRWP